MSAASADASVPSAGAWQAAGARHELLMRVLPAIRHDMAGPLSVARMGNTVLRRYLGAQPFDAALSLKRLGQTEEQLQLAMAGIRALGRWDIEPADAAVAPADLPAALEMARPMLDLYGMQLGEAVAAPEGWLPVTPGRVLYAVLGALAYLQDGATAPAAVQVERLPEGLRFAATPTGAAFDLAMRPAQRPLRVDAPVLANLLASLDWPAQISQSAVLLRAPAA